MRQHDGRESERRGALRPTVAAAMVRLAGEPGGTLLDPCCGSGTILAAAIHAGWHLGIRPALVDAGGVEQDHAVGQDVCTQLSWSEIHLCQVVTGQRYPVEVVASPGRVVELGSGAPREIEMP